jgi:hypothetical protein
MAKPDEKAEGDPVVVRVALKLGEPLPPGPDGVPREHAASPTKQDATKAAPRRRISYQTRLGAPQVPSAQMTGELHSSGSKIRLSNPLVT